jgi:Pyrimidine reductase, riboflavin biosynthesis
VPPRPYVLLSCATSADGYLDDASPERLILSGPADLDRVDEVRAGCDAILVGAQTVRADNPRLLIRDPRRSARRAARGLSRTRPGSPSPPPATWILPPASSPPARSAWSTAPPPRCGWPRKSRTAPY